MSHVIPTGGAIDSEFLFQRMEDETLDALGPAEGRRFADVAAGVGQDGRRLASRGAWAVGVEPSSRMTALAGLESKSSQPVGWVRAWSETLPFRDGSFDGAFCKGALDHFDDPVRCIEETARITTSDGRVVFAVANFESLGCRLARGLDRLAVRGGRRPGRGRRLYDVPSDHFTRYDPRLFREQLERHIVVESWRGVSLFWGVSVWSRLLRRLPESLARVLLRCADGIARTIPSWADVIVASGRPRAPIASR
jgi:SAM-dependent methyltransferase